jgi:DNA-binding response OmpR family regulator
LDEPNRSDRPVVLVADDDEDILALVSFRLDRAGYEVLSATDGEQALATILHSQPDLAVLDVRMPKMTGMDVVKGVRDADKVNRMPIILLSASVLDENISRGFELGADDYIKKPFNPQELLARIQAILGRR